MSNVLSSRDLTFLLYEWLKSDELIERERFADHSRQTFDAVLELAESIATEKFAPINRLLDAHEPYLDHDGKAVLPEELAEVLRVHRESGISSATFDEELGGMQLPFSVAQVAFLWFQAASVGAQSYSGLAIGNANLIAAHGTPEQIEKYAKPIIEGRWYGTMCLSEPHAGSSVGDITTKAVKSDDGSYRISGTKMWISGGDHELTENIIHLVLARTPGAPAGVKGISLFIVPKFLVADDDSLGERNDVVLAGLNHKMGWRGTTNTLLNFGEGYTKPHGDQGAIGYLVGEEGQGMALMFHMMNEARIMVGAGAVALGYTGYLHSLEYAKTRRQGRLATDKDPNGPMVPIVEHRDVRRMLLAQKSYVEGGLGLIMYCARLVDDAATAATPEERERAANLLQVLTPIAKSWPSQWCLAANDLAIQILGGSGYTRDFPVEQFYRDNRLNPIHEGTHGIQSLDLLGRKVIANSGAGLKLLAETLGASIDAGRGRGGEAALLAEALATRLERLAEVTGVLWADGDADAALANSALYLEAAGHIVIAWIWLEQLLAAGDQPGDFYDGKRAAARYFRVFELPTVDAKFDVLASGEMLFAELNTDVL